MHKYVLVSGLLLKCRVYTRRVIKSLFEQRLAQMPVVGPPVSTPQVGEEGGRSTQGLC